MKLKKRIAALLLAATAVVTAACMTACNDDGAGDGAGNNYVDDGRSEVIADAAAWKAAFDFSQTTNATFTMIGMGSSDSADMFKLDSSNRTDMVKFDGDKNYYKTSDSEGSMERYVMYSDEVFDEQYPDCGTEYCYSLDEDGNWKLKKSVINNRDTLDTIAKNVFELTSYYDEETGESVGYLDERFADFEYNDQTGRYEATIYSSYEQHPNFSVWLVFKGGKIYEGMYYVEFGGSVVYEINFTVTDIGTTTVTLPTVAE